MRKRFSVKALVVCLISIFSLAALPAQAGQADYSYVKLVRLVIGQKEARINDSPAVIDQPAYIKNSCTLVPLRFLGESLGARISWDEAKKEAGLKLRNTEVRVVIGAKAATVDGRMAQLDVPAEIKDGRTFVPLRFVSEALKAQVEYDAVTQTVTVTYIDTSTWQTDKPKTGQASYTYPADWIKTVNGSVTVFTGPSRAKASVSTASAADPLEYAKTIRNQWEGKGYRLAAEEYISIGTTAIGQKVCFGKVDETAPDSTMISIFEIVKVKEGCLVIEKTLQLGTCDFDNRITDKILNPTRTTTSWPAQLKEKILTIR